MRQLIPRLVITTILCGALSGVSAMNWNSIQQPPSVSGISAAARVTESGSVKHVGMIALVADSSSSGRAFEQAYFGQGGQAIYGATSGMYVQIVAPEDIPGGAKVGSVVALSHDGTEVIVTLTGPPTLSEIRTFSEWGKGMLSRTEAQHLAAQQLSPKWAGTKSLSQP